MGLQRGEPIGSGPVVWDHPQDVPLSWKVSGEDHPRIVVDLGDSGVAADVLLGDGTAAPTATADRYASTSHASRHARGGADALEATEAPFRRTGVSSSQTASDPQTIYGCTSAAITVTLASSMLADGAWVIVSDESGAAGDLGQSITIATEGSETINGAASLSLNADFESVELHSDGTNWFVTSATGSVI